jgi:hypothetical protein
VLRSSVALVAVLLVGCGGGRSASTTAQSAGSPAGTSTQSGRSLEQGCVDLWNQSSNAQRAILNISAATAENNGDAAPDRVFVTVYAGPTVRGAEANSASTGEDLPVESGDCMVIGPSNFVGAYTRGKWIPSEAMPAGQFAQYYGAAASEGNAAISVDRTDSSAQSPATGSIQLDASASGTNSVSTGTSSPSTNPAPGAASQGTGQSTGGYTPCPYVAVNGVAATRLEVKGADISCDRARTDIQAWRANDPQEAAPIGWTCAVQGAVYDCSEYPPNQGCGHQGYTSAYCSHLTEKVYMRFTRKRYD